MNSARKNAIKTFVLLVSWVCFSFYYFSFAEFDLKINVKSELNFPVEYSLPNPLFVIIYILMIVEKINFIELKKILPHAVLMSLIAILLPIILGLQHIHKSQYSSNILIVLTISLTIPVWISAYLFSMVKNIAILKKFAINALAALGAGIVVVEILDGFADIQPYFIVFWILSFVFYKFLSPLFELIHQDRVFVVVYKLIVGLYIAVFYALATITVLHPFLYVYAAFPAGIVMGITFIAGLCFIGTKDIHSYCVRTLCVGPFAILFVFLCFIIYIVFGSR